MSKSVSLLALASVPFLADSDVQEDTDGPITMRCPVSSGPVTKRALRRFVIDGVACFAYSWAEASELVNG